MRNGKKAPAARRAKKPVSRTKTIDALTELTKTFARSLRAQQRHNDKALALITETVTAATEAMKSQSASFNTYLDMFKVDEKPQPRIIRDIDEYEAEVNRLKEAGYPIDKSPSEQLRFAAKMMDEDIFSG